MKPLFTLIVFLVFVSACSPAPTQKWNTNASYDGNKAASLDVISPIHDNEKEIVPTLYAYCIVDGVGLALDMKTEIFGQVSKDRPRIKIVLNNISKDAQVTLIDSKVLVFGPAAIQGIRDTEKTHPRLSFQMSSVASSRSLEASFDITGMENAITSLDCK